MLFFIAAECIAMAVVFGVGFLNGAIEDLGAIAPWFLTGPGGAPHDRYLPPDRFVSEKKRKIAVLDPGGGHASESVSRRFLFRGASEP